jgi:hypothetical protein
MTVSELVKEFTSVLSADGFAYEVGFDDAFTVTMRSCYENSIDEVIVKADGLEHTVLDTHRNAPSMSIADLQRYDYQGFDPDTVKTGVGYDALGPAGTTSYDTLTWERAFSYEKEDADTYNTVINAVRDATSAAEHDQASFLSKVNIPGAWMRTKQQDLTIHPGRSYRPRPRPDEMPVGSPESFERRALDNALTVTTLTAVAEAKERVVDDIAALDVMGNDALQDKAEAKSTYLGVLFNELKRYHQTVRRSHAYRSLDQPNRYAQPTNRIIERATTTAQRRVERTV